MVYVGLVYYGSPFFLLRQLIEKFKEKKQFTNGFYKFIVLKKVYGKVLSQLIWQALKRSVSVIGISKSYET